MSSSSSTRMQRAAASEMQTTEEKTLEERITAIATDAFGDQAIAEKWLREPNIGLGNRVPIELIATPEGFEAVGVVLNQIKYGIIG